MSSINQIKNYGKYALYKIDFEFKVKAFFFCRQYVPKNNSDELLNLLLFLSKKY